MTDVRDEIAAGMIPDDPFERAAMQTRRGITPYPQNRVGDLAAFMAPETPLDYAMMGVTGPLGRVIGPAAKTAALVGGAMTTSTEAEAGPLSKIINRVVSYPKGVARVVDEPFHGFSGIRSGKAPEEVQAAYRGVTEPERTITRPEDLLGSELIFTPGDRTRAGGTLTSVGGTKLQRPTALEGGADYPLHYDPIWANAPAPSTKLVNTGKEILERGNQPVLMFQAMGKGAADQARQTANPALDLLQQGGLTRKGSAQFNTFMQNKVGSLAAVDDFPGINSKHLQSWLENEASAPQRSKFVKALDTRWAKEAGAPDIGELRMALADQRLLNTPTGSVGLTISKFDPMKGVTASGHTTYPAAVQGSDVGTFGGSIPWHIAAPDIHSALLTKGPTQKFADRPAYYMMQEPPKGVPKTQVVDEAWVNRVNNWMRENPALWSTVPGAATLGELAAQDRRD